MRQIRNKEYLQRVYEGKLDLIQNSVLYTGGERFDRHQAGRVMKITSEQAQHALDRMTADGHLERIEEMRCGRGYVVWRKRQPSQASREWVRSWVQSLNYSPQWY